MTSADLLQVLPTFHERTTVDSINLKEIVFLSTRNGVDKEDSETAKLILEHTVGECVHPFDYFCLRVECSGKLYDIDFNHLPDSISHFSDVSGARPVFNMCIAELSSHRAYLRLPVTKSPELYFTPRDEK